MRAGHPGLNMGDHPPGNTLTDSEPVPEGKGQKRNPGEGEKNLKTECVQAGRTLRRVDCVL